MDIENDKIYYTVNNSAYAISTTATAASTTPILTANVGYLYGFAVNNDHIFIADSGDFKADSKAYIYSLSGTLQKEIGVGVGPNGFYFND